MMRGEYHRQFDGFSSRNEGNKIKGFTLIVLADVLVPAAPAFSVELHLRTLASRIL